MTTHTISVAEMRVRLDLLPMASGISRDAVRSVDYLHRRCAEALGNSNTIKPDAAELEALRAVGWDLFPEYARDPERFCQGDVVLELTP